MGWKDLESCSAPVTSWSFPSCPCLFPLHCSGTSLMSTAASKLNVDFGWFDLPSCSMSRHTGIASVAVAHGRDRQSSTNVHHSLGKIPLHAWLGVCMSDISRVRWPSSWCVRKGVEEQSCALGPLNGERKAGEDAIESVDVITAENPSCAATSVCEQ